MKWIDVILAIVTSGLYIFVLSNLLKFDGGDDKAIGLGMIAGTIITLFIFLFTVRAILGFRRK